MTEHGESLRGFSQRAGLTATYVGKLKRGEMQNPSAEALDKLAAAMSMSSEELISKLNDRKYVKTKDIKQIGFQMIPLFSGLSCGTGELVDEQAEESVPIPDAWVAPGKSYFANYADGDSMTGRGIHNGDILIFEKADTLESGQVGSFCLDGENLCKIFREVKPGLVILESANPAYSPILVDLKEHPDFRIIGLLKAQMTRR